MTVRIQGVVQARQQLQAIEDFLNSRRPMEGIVEDIAEGIQKKTAAGHDYRGRNFKRYSAAYAKRKGSSHVNLKVSGVMLRAIKTAVLSARHGRIFVYPAREAANRATGQGQGIRADMLAQIHNTGTGKQPQREFMNIAPSAVKKLVKKHYDDPILEIVRRYR